MIADLDESIRQLLKEEMPIKNGEITVEAAAKEFLENPITEPYW